MTETARTLAPEQVADGPWLEMYRQMTKIRLFGLGQPIADGVKFFFKAEYTPAHVDKGLYFLAPMTIFITAIAVFAVIPFGSLLPADAFPASWGLKQINLVIAPGIDVGMTGIIALV